MQGADSEHRRWDSTRGSEFRVIATPGVRSICNGVAVRRDGSTLLVSDFTGGSHAIHEISSANGSRLRVIGEKGSGPLQFNGPSHLWIASDDHVFVTDCWNHRVQVLAPDLSFHSFVGMGEVNFPAGVCANSAVVAVSEGDPAHSIAVFNRHDGALVRRFGCNGSGDGQFDCPQGVCFMPDGDRHVAVADCWNDRVSVYSVEGEFVRHVGVGVLKRPRGVACSALGELVVADTDNKRVVVFNARGDIVNKLGRGRSMFSGVALHRGTKFVQSRDSDECLVFT